MKIGIVTTYFYPFPGGVEVNILNLAKELSKNHEIHIFSSDRKNNKIIEKKEEKLGNIFIHRSKTLFRFKYYVAFYPSLLTNLLKYDLDIIHVNSLGFLWHDFCILIKKLFSRKTRFVITPHGPFMTLKSYPLWQKFLRSIVNNLIILTNKVYNAVIEVNTFQDSWLRKDYGFNKNKIFYVPNGIKKEIFKKLNTNKVIKKYNLEDRFILSYIGRLHEYKGVQNIIEVLPEIINRNKKILFIAIGEDAGYYKILLEKTKKLKLEKNILFLTNCNDEDRDSILQLSEIYIMPSEWEAFGITILEAMAKGNAIISTNTEGGKFLISKNNGLLYNFNNTKKLKDHISYLIKNKNIREKMQKTNIEKAKQFTWDKISKKLNRIYNELDN